MLVDTSRAHAVGIGDDGSHVLVPTGHVKALINKFDKPIERHPSMSSRANAAPHTAVTTSIAGIKARTSTKKMQNTVE